VDVFSGVCLLSAASREARQGAGILFTPRPILRFFAPQVRYVAPMMVKFGKDEGKFLLRFDQNVEYKRPTGA